MAVVYEVTSSSYGTRELSANTRASSTIHLSNFEQAKRVSLRLKKSSSTLDFSNLSIKAVLIPWRFRGFLSGILLSNGSTSSLVGALDPYYTTAGMSTPYVISTVTIPGSELGSMLNTSTFTEVSFEFPTPAINPGGYQAGVEVPNWMVVFAVTGSNGSAHYLAETNGLSDTYYGDGYAYRNTTYVGYTAQVTIPDLELVQGQTVPWLSTGTSGRMFMKVYDDGLSSAPTDITLSSLSIAENAAAQAEVAQISATDSQGGAMTFSLVSGSGSSDNSSFEIVGSALKLASGVSLNFEQKTAYNIRIRATDSTSLSYEESFVISVTNVNEQPYNISLSAMGLTEGNSVGQVIGTMSVSDSDAGDSHAFSIVPGFGDASSFTVSGNQLKAAEVFDAEVKTAYSVKIKAQDAGGLFVEQVFAITVQNDTSDDGVSLSGSEVTTLPLGKVVALVTVDPRSVSVKQNGQNLPVGSVLKNAVEGKKFFKFGPGEFEFTMLYSTAPTGWAWSATGVQAWSSMHDL